MSQSPPWPHDICTNNDSDWEVFVEDNKKMKSLLEESRVSSRFNKLINMHICDYDEEKKNEKNYPTENLTPYALRASRLKGLCLMIIYIRAFS